MAFNRTEWRANVRAAYAAQTSNPEHRGAWGYPGTERRSAFGIGRGKPRNWPHFGKKGGMTLLTTETYVESQNETYTYNDATPTATGERTYNYAFTANVAISRWDVLPVESIDESNLPPAYAYRLHSSATPYGAGLYDAQGLIVVYAPTLRHEVITMDGTLGGPDSDVTTTDTEEYIFRYESDATAIDGLATPARVTAQQQYHGPVNAFRPAVVVDPDLPGGDDDVVTFIDIPFLPLETNPDGETVDSLGNLQVEMFFTDTFLASLVSGTFIGTEVRVTGSAGAVVPSHDETSNLDNVTWSHDWTRSGTLTLTIL